MTAIFSREDELNVQNTVQELQSLGQDLITVTSQ